MIPKPARLVDRDAIERLREDYPVCEYCRRHATEQIHHIVTRGSGGPDLRENLIALCTVHHSMAHTGQIRKDSLQTMVAHREGISMSELQKRVRRARSG